MTTTTVQPPAAAPVLDRGKASEAARAEIRATIDKATRAPAVVDLLKRAAVLETRAEEARQAHRRAASRIDQLGGAIHRGLVDGTPTAEAEAQREEAETEAAKLARRVEELQAAAREAASRAAEARTEAARAAVESKLPELQRAVQVAESGLTDLRARHARELADAEARLHAARVTHAEFKHADLPGSDWGPGTTTED